MAMLFDVNLRHLCQLAPARSEQQVRGRSQGPSLKPSSSKHLAPARRQRGPALHTPRREDHPRQPFGPYGRSKALAEDYLFKMRQGGFRTTILRPRLIMGPGRLGIFTKLFRLVDLGLPVPLIGDGSNRFQFISVSDCARASLAAVARGFPDAEINLGSANPPTEFELLQGLIAAAGSRSRVLRTPGPGGEGAAAGAEQSPSRSNGSGAVRNRGPRGHAGHRPRTGGSGMDPAAR